MIQKNRIITKKNIVLVIFIFFALINANTNSNVPDDIDIENRNLNYFSFEKYKNNEAFKYEYEVTPPKNLGFFAKLLKLIDDFLSKSFQTLGKIPWFVWVIVCSIIALIIIYYGRGNLSKFLYANQENKLEYSISDEIDLSMNFDNKIAEAIDLKNFRSAIRFSYLKLVSILNQRELINFSIEKTNRDYEYELEKVPIKNNFKYLTKIYEYVWYGDFLLRQDEFMVFNTEFKNTYKKLDE